MKKLSVSLILEFLVLYSFGQLDSTKLLKPTRYNSFRFGIGYEKASFIELGFSRITLVDKGLNSGSLCYYASGQFGIKNNQAIYGVKAGIESAWMIIMWAIEGKYITNSKLSKFYITPKVGLSLLGFANILYGYNFRIGNNNFTNIGQHQVSFVVNLSKKLIKDHYK
jgi:hypothetical protein